ncbi:acyltransferase [Achromobacter insolitus]|uniref:acyltransferase family protein n=1 Tax=Achromobacter insolitus TaxID=217204 RepID=UPI0011EB14AB|nr:acyltransferase [Achromobacter insolitus]QEK93991.1 acyltransferase [Achromobacter insolitus]
MESTKQHPKILSLEGLRGVAALAVVFSHLALQFFPHAAVGGNHAVHSSIDPWLYNSPFRVLYAGFFAVCIFFVMSGYVLSRKFLRTHDNNILIDATAKRYFRLAIPVLVSCILMVVTASLVQSMDGLGSRLWGASGEALYGAFIYGSNSYNKVIWTMQVEFLGSMILFAFLFVFGRFGFAPLAAIALCAVMMYLNQLTGYFFAMFIIGIYIDKLTFLFRHWVVSVPMFLFGLYLGAYDGPASAYRQVAVFANVLQFDYGIRLNWPVLFPGLGAILVVATTLALGPVNSFFSSRIPVWLGKVSFSLYLTHMIVLLVVAAPVANMFASMGSVPAALIACVASVIASLAVSVVFYRLVDKPSVTFANWFGRLIVAAFAKRAHTGPLTEKAMP